MNGTINKVILVGNIGEEMKYHQFSEDSSIFRFSLATSEYYVDKESGEKKSTTEWHTVVTKNKLAEFCSKYLKKGDKVFVEGKIKTRKWGDTEKKYITEIIADTLQIIYSKKSDAHAHEPEPHPESE